MKAKVKTRVKEWTIEFYSTKFKRHTYHHITISDNTIGWKKISYTICQYEDSIISLNIPKKVKEKALEMLKKIKEERV